MTILSIYWKHFRFQFEMLHFRWTIYRVNRKIQKLKRQHG